jgi:hypothetical protein
MSSTYQIFCWVEIDRHSYCNFYGADFTFAAAVMRSIEVEILGTLNSYLQFLDRITRAAGQREPATQQTAAGRRDNNKNQIES